MHIGKEVVIDPALASWLLLLVVFGSISPWLWIGFSDRVQTSAWGTVAFQRSPRFSERNQDGADSSPEEHGSSHEANTIWVPIVITYLVAVSILYLIKEPERCPELLCGYVLSFAMAFAILKSAYNRFGHAAGKNVCDVNPGLMMNFFIFGGLLGIGFAVVFQIPEQMLCSKAFRSCSMVYLDRDPEIREPSLLTPLTLSCSLLSAIMWILVEGVVEETAKAMWLFWRLRKHGNDMPNRCFFNQCSTLHGAECAGFFKLAPSPRHVLLCALSCGAGYQCLDNVKYGFHRTPLPQGFADRAHYKGVHPSLLMVSAFVFLTSLLHIVWTGVIGAGLAKRMFGRVHEKPSLSVIVLPSILLHGVFDWALASLHNLTMRRPLELGDATTGVQLQHCFVAIMVTSACASCALLYRRCRNLPGDIDGNLALLG